MSMIFPRKEDHPGTALAWRRDGGLIRRFDDLFNKEAGFFQLMTHCCDGPVRIRDNYCRVAVKEATVKGRACKF